MRISKERLTAILSSAHQLPLGAVIGISIGAVLALAAVWYARHADVRFETVGVMLAAPVLLAWVSYAFVSLRTERRASKLATLLNSPETVVRYDGARRRLIVESVGTVDCGLGPTQAVLDRAEMTVQEAEKIGFATDERPRRLLIGGGPKPQKSDPTAADTIVENARPVEPLPEAAFARA